MMLPELSRLSPKLVNFILLVGAFGVGSGSLFLAMNWLYWGQHFELISSFGTAYPSVTLLLLVVDWGSNLLLAREATDTRHSAADVSSFYSVVSVIRSVTAVVIVVPILLLWWTDTGFVLAYLAFSGPGLIAYAWNAVGLLDGRGKSGLSGLSQALPTVANAVALPLCVNASPAVAGAIVGGVFAAAQIAAVVIQTVAIPRAWLFDHRYVTWAKIVTTIRWALPGLLMPLPGQMLYRGQVYIGAAFLSPEAMALFVYARQIIGIGYQMAGFVIRVDLVEFSTRVRQPSASMYRDVVLALSSRLAMLVAAAMFAVSIAADVLVGTKGALFGSLILYTPCVATLALSSNLQRAFLLRHRETAMLSVQVVTVTVTMIAMYATIGIGGVQTLMIGELLSQVAQVILLMGLWRGRQPST